jgi:hypothetical protein
MLICGVVSKDSLLTSGCLSSCAVSYYCGSSVDQDATVTLTVIVGVSVMTALAAAVATLRSMQLAHTVQIVMLVQGAAAVGVSGARSSPFFGEQLHEAMTYLNFINFGSSLR